MASLTTNKLAKLLSRDWGAFAKPFGPSQSHQQQLRHQSNDQPNVLLGLNAQRPPQDRYRNSHPNLHVPLSRITKFDRAVDQSSDDSEQQHLAGNATEWSIVSLSQSATPQNWTGSLFPTACTFPFRLPFSKNSEHPSEPCRTSPCQGR